MTTIAPAGSSFATDRQWRYVFIACSVIIAILLPSLSPAYGQTGDEWLQIFYGRDIWDYFFNGDTQALGYDKLLPRYKGMETQFLGQELYGGLFDFGTEILHRWFPSIPQLIIRHACNALTNVVLMISTGLIARRLSGRWSVGVLALFLILFSPRIFGEGMNNPKDIPFAAGFALALYAVIALLQDGSRRMVWHGVLLALGFGLAFGVRAAGGLLFFAYLLVTAALWFLLSKENRQGWWAEKKIRKRILWVTVGGLVAGYIIGLLAWPWGLQSPINNPIESLKGMTHRATKIRTLFEGSYQWNYAMPWYYEIKWILISNPISVIFGSLVFLVLGFLRRKQTGSFLLSWGLFAALFPLLYMAYKHSSVYDTWRHVFFVYPFWVIIAAIGWAWLGDMLAKILAKNAGQKAWYIGPGLAFLLTLPAVFWTFRSHPNQYVYFNEFVGGIKGAEGNYELDYYYNSSQQQVDWLRKNAPHIPGKKEIVLANMGGFGPDCLHGDTAYIAPSYLSYYKRATQPWDYYLMFPRLIPEGLVKNKNWLPAHPIHVVSVDGVPLSALIKRSDTFDLAAMHAMSAGNFAGAAQYWALHLKTDSNDPIATLNYAAALAQSGQIKEAISVAQKASNIDPEDAQAWSMLAQLYQAAGNAAAARDANARAQGIMMAMQGDAPEE
ncbi:MAG: tetratricopeptide repeat protein [Bacteroidetes bacterium]|nr:tetratricopeptide repeat protein [Bacteroidota bacterium]